MKSPSLAYAPNEHDSQCGTDICVSQFYLKWTDRCYVYMIKLLRYSTYTVGETIICLSPSQNSEGTHGKREREHILLKHHLHVKDPQYLYITIPHWILHTSLLSYLIIPVFTFRYTYSHVRIPQSHHNTYSSNICDITNWYPVLKRHLDQLLVTAAVG